MALNDNALGDLRRSLAGANGPVRWDKATVNAAFNAIDAEIATLKTGLRTAVNTASGFTFTAGEVNQMFRLYLAKKFDLGG